MIRSPGAHVLILTCLLPLGCNGTKSDARATSGNADLAALVTFPLQWGAGLTLRAGVQAPVGPARADVIYFHGFADRLDNHGPLFAELAAAGYRVLSFDYPSHGETDGWLNHLDLYGFEDLAKMAVQLEQGRLEDPERPLFLAGWSTGGLLAVRMVQGLTFPEFSRPVAGVVLYAPGVAVRTLVGENGFVTLRTLTSNPNPPHLGPIKPQSPFQTPIFATTRLVPNAAASRAEQYPDLPTLVFVADNDLDRYVESPGLVDWVHDQRPLAPDILAIQCGGARHELDNEPEPVGDTVRGMTVEFLDAVVAGGLPAPAQLPDACWEF
jgi:alpha-beta hydrolase superfamily lysophospholipase